MSFQLIEEQLYRSMSGLDRARTKQYLVPLNAALVEFEFESGLEVSHFLGQLAHESLDLKYWTELWGPTKTQLRYECRLDLGNTQPGDGKRFMGRGPIQTTGRANYQRVATALKIDCISHPELLSTPEHGFRAAGLFWQENNCKKFALADDITGLTRRINGGLNGLNHRIICTRKAKQALGLLAKD